MTSLVHNSADMCCCKSVRVAAAGNASETDPAILYLYHNLLSEEKVYLCVVIYKILSKILVKN